MLIINNISNVLVTFICRTEYTLSCTCDEIINFSSLHIGMYKHYIYYETFYIYISQILFFNEYINI